MAWLADWQATCMEAGQRHGAEAGCFDAVGRSVRTRMDGGAGVALAMEISKWAQEQFGACELGDRRRTKRLVKFAAQAATMPDASTPKQTEGWSDCKAAYRLFA